MKQIHSNIKKQSIYKNGNGSESEENNSFIFGSPQLEVSTTDFAGNLVEGPAILVITVIDQNDNRPIFKETSYRGEVLEGSPTGRWLIHRRTQERSGLLLNLVGKQHHAHYECCSDLQALCCGAVDVVCIRCPGPRGYYVTWVRNTLVTAFNVVRSSRFVSLLWHLLTPCSVGAHHHLRLAFP